MLENTEGAIKHEQSNMNKSRETGNIGLTRQINVREYWRGNQIWTIKRNWQHRAHKKKTKKTKKNTICVGHHYTPTNTNNVNKTWVLLQKRNRTSFLCGIRNGHSFIEENDDLPNIYWMPTFDGNPYRERYITGSSTCTTTKLSLTMTWLKLCL